MPPKTVLEPHQPPSAHRPGQGHPERPDDSHDAPDGLPGDDLQTVDGGTKSTTPEVEREAPFLSRSGRATSSNIAGKPPEIVAKSSANGFPYTNPLHNRPDDPLKSGGNRGRTRGTRPYTKPLHIRGSGIVLNDNRYFYRRRVPASLKGTVGKGEIWRSLGIDSLSTARRRSHHAALSVERIFAAAAHSAGTALESRWLIGERDASDRATTTTVASNDAPDAGPSLREVFDAYMADPTHDWSPRTRLAYTTTQRLLLAILGDGTPIRSITRARCREFIEVLKWMPLNASKRFPRKSPVAIAEAAKRSKAADLISPANINTYLNKLGGVFNWALNEELIDRNPATGLRVPDPTLRRDKRLPFSTQQLRAIFAAPLYTGCRDDGHGYFVPGPNRPKGARFWIPLIGLFNGLRLNEACQLDVADIVIVEGISCFAVTAAANVSTDKRLKTLSSERLVPVHPQLLGLGFEAFVARRSEADEPKLFHEVALGATGYRSATFSAWFARFTAKAGATTRKTCFHSFRHSFRDALREAGIERDVALALGGWSRTGGSGGSASVSDSYGSGYRIGTLFEAISKVGYPDLDLSHLRERV